jgi:hypothetical protein
MRRFGSLLMGLLLATLIHIDWHMARPAHYHLGGRLGLGWPYHWMVTALVFAIAGWFIARTWPEKRWRVGAESLAIGVVIGQGIEPMLEVAQAYHRFGYPDEPARMTAFWQTMLAAVPAYAIALWLSVRKSQRMAPQA